MVNLEKFAFCFSCNISGEEAESFSQLLGIPYATELESYLGLPVHVGRSKLAVFSNIISWVWKQLLS